MDSMSPADETPLTLFLRSTMRQSGKPTDGNGNGTSIIKIDGERIRDDTHINGAGDADFNC